MLKSLDGREVYLSCPSKKGLRIYRSKVDNYAAFSNILSSHRNMLKSWAWREVNAAFGAPSTYNYNNPLYREISESCKEVLNG